MQDQNTVTSHAPHLSRYIVQGSDVISDVRINISEERSDQVIWYKERFLSDDEIVEHVVHNPSSTICWTIHRPKRGWYIRVRAPSFPPGVFIPILPLPRDSPYHVEAALSLSCRTNLPEPDSPSPDVSIHSYPPTPPAIVIRPPSPSSAEVKPRSLPTRRSLPANPPPPAPHISQFILAPHSTPHVPIPAENSSFFTRVISAIKNHRPSHSSSFTISLLPSILPMPSPPPYMGTCPPISSNLVQTTAFVTFHDRTPLLAVHAITGLLEIDQSMAQTLGVQASFWIAVALTYLEFLQEREGYLAASSD